jgi:serine protease Do
MPIKSIPSRIQFPLFRVILYIIAIVALILSGIFGLIIVNKDSNISKWIVENTPLKSILNLGNQSKKDTNKNQINQPIANTLLGLTSDTNALYRFATPEKSLSPIEVVDAVLPSVLSINVKANSTNTLLADAVSGTGYIVSKKGLVVTNKHVISPLCNTNGTYTVTGVDSTQKPYILQLLSVDPVEDLAILTITNPDKEFNPVQFNNSSTLKLGTEVLAIGNALGQLQNTVTRGIVSGLDRDLLEPIQDACTGRDVLPDSLIQTDAAINKGNSGGPLFDSTGLLIGMNTYGTGGENIGLAIPSARIVAALNSFEKNNKIIRPRLGVSTQSISPVLKKNNPWIPQEYGELIYARRSNPIVQGSGAEKAGLKEGDIILEVNGTKLTSSPTISSPLKRTLLGFQVNDEIELTVLRAEKTETAFTYKGSPEKVRVQLGGQSFDLPNNTLVQ